MNARTSCSPNRLGSSPRPRPRRAVTRARRSPCRRRHAFHRGNRGAPDLLANWFIRRAEGTAAPMAQRAAEGWPGERRDPGPLSRQQFVDGLSRLTAWADATGDALDTPLTPAIEFPPLAHYTKRDVLVRGNAQRASPRAGDPAASCSAHSRHRPAAGPGEHV